MDSYVTTIYKQANDFSQNHLLLAISSRIVFRSSHCHRAIGAASCDRFGPWKMALSFFRQKSFREQKRWKKKTQTICKLINKSDYGASHENYSQSARMLLTPPLAYWFSQFCFYQLLFISIKLTACNYLTYDCFTLCFTVLIRHREQMNLRLPLAKECRLNTSTVENLSCAELTISISSAQQWTDFFAFHFLMMDGRRT